MSENPQNQEPTPAGNQPEFPSRHEDRMRRREERWAARDERRAAGGSGRGAWIGGAILIILGLVFLLQNMGLLVLVNWWALFILIPAVAAFGSAWRSYQAAGGRLTGGARGSLIGGLVLVLVAGVFLFGLNWGVVGPLLLVLAGIGLLLNAFLPS